MKLIIKGKYKGIEQLPKGNLPSNAVKFKEPETPAKLNAAAVLYTFLALGIALVLIAITVLLHDEIIALSPNLIGIILAFLCILPHEILHGICFPKDAEVYLFYSLKNLMAFVVCTEPVSKGRFIFLSLLPNLVFGWIPLIIWMVLPSIPTLSNILLSFSIVSISFGAGDYMNVFNALRQMPKGSMQQLSGFNSYWFIPK